MTPSIAVKVKTSYLEDQSSPADRRFVFGYTITVQNQGPVAAQLISRHWIITDANNKVQEVQGVGVIGQQPHIEPGESYTYTSGVVLPTDTGTMRGSYLMRTEAGEEFDTPIPTFVLVPPHRLH